MGDRVSQTLIVTTPPAILGNRTRNPIRLNTHAGHSVWGEIRYERGAWGVGGTGWGYSTDHTSIGRVESLDAVSIPGATTFTIRTVDLWNETLSPVTNQLEDSGMSPVSYRARGQLSVYTTAFFVSRNLGAEGSSRFELLVGVQTGHVSAEQDRRLDQRAFIFDYFEPGIHFNNLIELSTGARVKFHGAGPMVGLGIDTSWRRLNVQLRELRPS